MDEARWPVGRFPLVPGVQPPGFAPVTEAALVEIVHRIVAALHPKQIILFGSYAYGTPSHDSDVALLVVMEIELQPVLLSRRKVTRAGLATVCEFLG